MHPPIRAHLAGIPSLGSEVNKSSIDALHKGELIAAPILILVLLFVFRSPVAGVPLLIAAGTVVTGFGLISIILEFTDVDAIALSAASMIGLALGVDYSLLIVTRFRSSLAEGHAPKQAGLDRGEHRRANSDLRRRAAGHHRGRVPPIPAHGPASMALGMGVVTVLSMIGAILVSPAVTSLLGHRINKWQIGGAPTDDGGAISRVVAWVSRRAALAAGLLAALLLLTASPVLGIDDSCGSTHAAEGQRRSRRLQRTAQGALRPRDRRCARGAARDAARARAARRDRPPRAPDRKLPPIRAVTGPGLIADATAEVRKAPKQIGRSRRDLTSAERELTSRSRQLWRAARRTPAGERRQPRPRPSTAAACLRTKHADSGEQPYRRRGAVEARIDGCAGRRRRSRRGNDNLSEKAELLAAGLSEISSRVDGLIPRS